MINVNVVWIKRDARTHDHGPLRYAAENPEQCIVLYVYEKDQLLQPSLHGSHVSCVNEGLTDLDSRLSVATGSHVSCVNEDLIDLDSRLSVATSLVDCYQPLRTLTVCYSTILQVLTMIHTKFSIKALLAHEETGHYSSYQRDRRVRAWCKQSGIKMMEFEQSGVTRRLGDRDDFSKLLNAFMAKPQHPPILGDSFKDKIIRVGLGLPGQCESLLCPTSLTEIPAENSGDRESRQVGGETEALRTLSGFLESRGKNYSRGISSPNSSWDSCSRLSIFLAWGHISVRYVVQAVRRRQAELKALKSRGVHIDECWGRSLSAFQSRLHWRSHFMQKLESEPLLEKKDLCPSYQHLRRGTGDFNADFYEAWKLGRTGFPFLDACIRCLIKHGWLNFRMRAMVVSFATYNLWLDWKKIAPHLARLFLDFEPGIHYPQLQMQSGTTGINAMRVYNVTKQGKDQDPRGEFVRKFVLELRSVKDEFIHEPWKMTKKDMARCKVQVGTPDEARTLFGGGVVETGDYEYYPGPIVNEKESAKAAKDKVAAVRNMTSTKREAEVVFEKHGSRKGTSDYRKTKGGGKKVKVGVEVRAAGAAGGEEKAMGQKSIIDMFAGKGGGKKNAREGGGEEAVELEVDNEGGIKTWTCTTCTFENTKVHAPVCEVCCCSRAS
ncbi:hypothetical protein TrRE_jg6469 [Triparma retinervis]|uniref:Photolyase/cryptochrome alpha/beta domain-containing protein n=1 Tax=Triparma retinervis TaxID=2557542 RepID=A0A9W7DKB5_9STRA|nr:hypothetical protein TrRE_jg6469 [Triparma retinervis]